MAEAPSGARPSVMQLILLPALLTLAVTILRLIGELQHWSPMFFNSSPGGGGALVGISWLPIIFGPYFALKLAGTGDAPASTGKSIAFPVLGLAVLILGGFVSVKGAQAQIPSRVIAAFFLGFAIMAVGAALCFAGWGALSKTLLAYGLAARIPVAIVMIFALRGNWGTHYDGLPPGYNGPTALLPKWVMTGLIPQMLLWVSFTIVLGSLFGAIVSAVARRGKPAVQTAS